MVLRLKNRFGDKTSPVGVPLNETTQREQVCYNSKILNRYIGRHYGKNGNLDDRWLGSHCS